MRASGETRPLTLQTLVSAGSLADRFAAVGTAYCCFVVEKGGLLTYSGAHAAEVLAKTLPPSHRVVVIERVRPAG